MTHTAFSDYIKVVALGGALFAILSASPAPGGDDSSALAAARARNPSLNAYTFHMSIAMAMHHFPWLHFHLDGDGQYVRGQNYVVHLNSAPFFAKSIKKIDLSVLEPSMWESNYTIAIASENDGMTTFQLRPKQVDPDDKNPITQALVTLDANNSTREVQMQYSDGGEIHLALTPGDTGGFKLPQTCDAEINMPGQALSAHAEFTDYNIERSSLGANN